MGPWRVGMLLAVLALGILVARAFSGDASGDDRSRAVVSHVIDGDTVEITTGDHVRLIGIDTPEIGECGYGAATSAMRRMVEGRTVVLVDPGSVRDVDTYGRLLRYVEFSGTDAGLAQLRAGARARSDSRDGLDAHPREEEYHRAAVGHYPGCAR